MNIDIAFSRKLLSILRAELTAEEKAKLKTSWVWKSYGDHWEFHGPDKFYWHGRANDAYEARYKGTSAWREIEARAKV